MDYFLRLNKLLVIDLNDGHDTVGKEMMLEIKTPSLKQIQVVVDKKEVCTRL